MPWVPRKVTTRKVSAPAFQAFGNHTAHRDSSNTHTPVGTGPAPTQAGPSTVNALQLKSYFSKQVFASSFPLPAVALAGGLHTPRGLGKRQPLGDVLWISPQCPAPSRGSCQLCRADRLHQALDPIRYVSYHPLPPKPTCLSLAPASTMPRGAAEKSPGQVWTACPLGKWYGPPLSPCSRTPFPASLISQPAEPDLENTSQFNQE